MKTYAGELYFELPGDWDHSAEIIFQDARSKIEVRVERSPVTARAVPGVLMDRIDARVRQLGPVEDIERGDTEVAGRTTATLSVRCKREGDSEASIMKVAVLKIDDTTAITVTATAPASREKQLVEAWRHVLLKTRLVEVRADQG